MIDKSSNRVDNQNKPVQAIKVTSQFIALGLPPYVTRVPEKMQFYTVKINNLY